MSSKTKIKTEHRIVLSDSRRMNRMKDESIDLVVGGKAMIRLKEKE